MKAEICIGILGNLMVESNLLGGINLNESNLDYLLGNGHVCIEWWQAFFPNNDKMKNYLTITTMQQYEHEQY